MPVIDTAVPCRALPQQHWQTEAETQVRIALAAGSHEVLEELKNCKVMLVGRWCGAVPGSVEQSKQVGTE